MENELKNMCCFTGEVITTSTYLAGQMVLLLTIRVEENGIYNLVNLSFDKTTYKYAKKYLTIGVEIFVKAKYNSSDNTFSVKYFKLKGNKRLYKVNESTPLIRNK